MSATSAATWSGTWRITPILRMHLLHSSSSGPGGTTSPPGPLFLGKRKAPGVAEGLVVGDEALGFRIQGGFQYWPDVRHAQGPAHGVLIARIDEVYPPELSRIHPQFPG